jgi:hypothetical protein
MKFLVENWSKIGGIIAVGIILVILFTGLKVTDIKFLLWIHFVLLLLHQVEEYSYPGGFENFYNQHIWNKNPIMKFPLNQYGILLVNVVLGWTAYLVSAFFNLQLLWLAVGLLLISILNGLAHTIMFVMKRRYNPGFFTGLFLFVPFGLYVLLKLSGMLTMGQWGLGILTFIVGTASIPLSIFLTYKIKVPEKR